MENKIRPVITNRSSAANSLYDVLKTIIFVMILITLLFVFVVRDASVVGASMKDTLMPNDKVVITNIFYQPECGDIVVIKTDKLEEKRIIKRVIAKGGQTLKIDYETGRVIVDGIEISEPYISSQTMQPSDPFEIPEVIPEGYIFVMGDNRDVSLDSRYEKLGLVPVSDVIGKAQFVVFPFDRMKYLY